jgi:cell division protein FtsB
MQAAIPFTIVAEIVFIVGAVLLVAAIRSALRRQRHAGLAALNDEVAALRDEVERLRGRIERMEKSDRPPIDAIKEERSRLNLRTIGSKLHFGRRRAVEIVILLAALGLQQDRRLDVRPSRGVEFTPKHMSRLKVGLCHGHGDFHYRP